MYIFFGNFLKMSLLKMVGVAEDAIRRLKKVSKASYFQVFNPNKC